MRNGRYVIPLKAENKGKIPGIVHDSSASGATLWIEPLETLELNNRWRELQLDEEKEIRRILLALTDMVARRTPSRSCARSKCWAISIWCSPKRATPTISRPSSRNCCRSSRARGNPDHPGSTI